MIPTFYSMTAMETCYVLLHFLLQLASFIELKVEYARFPDGLQSTQTCLASAQGLVHVPAIHARVQQKGETMCDWVDSGN